MTETSGTRPPYGRRVGVAISLIILGLLALVAAILLTSFGSLANVNVNEWDPFPIGVRPTGPAVPPIVPPKSAVASTVRVIIGSDVRVTAKARLPARDTFTRAVSSGRGRDQAEKVADYIAGVSVVYGDKEIRVAWSAPTVSRRSGKTAVVTVTGRTRRVDTPGDVTIHALTIGCAKGCTQVIDVATDGERHIAGARPQYAVVRQMSDRVQLKTSSPSERITLIRVLATAPASPTAATPARPAPEEFALPSQLRAWMSAILLGVFAFLPWWMLRSRIPTQTVGTADADVVTEWRAATFRLLLLAGLALATITAAYLDLPLIDLHYRVKALIADHFQDGWPYANEVEVFANVYWATSVPAMIAGYACWSLAAVKRGPGRLKGLLVPLWAPLLVLALTGAAAATLYFAWRSGGMVNDEPDAATRAAFRAAIVAGAAIGVVALLLLARAFKARRPWLAGLGAAAVLVLSAMLVATSNATYPAVRGDWAAGTLALAVIALAWAGAFWLTIGVAFPEIAQRWRTWWWLLASFIVATAMATRAERFTGRPWITIYDSIGSAYTLQVLLRLLLVLATIGLMYRTASVNTWRPTAMTWLAAAMMLRPELLYMNIPLSFLVGLALIVTVLLPASALVQPLLPETGQDDRDKREQVLTGMAAQRLQRDHGVALRRKIASAEMSQVEISAAAQALRDALGPAAAPTSFNPQRALGWAGFGDPWKRAWRGAVASGGLGLLFYAATLSRSLSELHSVIGQSTSAAVLLVLATFRFPLYGLVFGFLYPRIPGQTGLAKATRLFVVLALSEAVAVLVPLQADATSAVALRMAQVLAVCILLGVGADLYTLRAGGRETRELAVLYHTNPLALGLSGVAVAAGTAIATTMLSSAATLLVENLLPSPPTPPPPSQHQSQSR